MSAGDALSGRQFEHDKYPPDVVAQLHDRAPIDAFEGAMHARRTVRQLAEHYGVSAPNVIPDHPIGVRYHPGRHGRYSPMGQGTIYVVRLHEGIDHVVAHEFQHHLDAQDGRPRVDTHNPAFYDRVNDVLGSIQNRWGDR